MKKNTLFKKMMASRRLKYGTSAVVIMLSMIVLFVVMNLLVGLIPWQLDLTPEGLYSIGDQTKELLDNVDKEVTIYGLFDETKVDSESNYWGILDLLKKYDKYDNVSVEYVDINKNLGFVTDLDPDQILDITSDNFVVISGESKKVIKYFDMFYSIGSETSAFGTVTDVGSRAELAFTSAIYYVTRDNRPKIYITIGHDEYTFEDDYISLGEITKSNGFDSEMIDLSITGGIPDDATMVLIANPTSDFSKDEIAILTEFMEDGKSIMVVLDSLESPERFEDLQGFLSNYNLAYNYDVIKEGDENYHLVGNRYMIFPDLYRKTLLNNPIKDVFTNMIAENARSIDILRKSNSSLEIDPLIITSDKALSESILTDGKDVAGARYLGVAVEDYQTGSRIIALGSADFVQDLTLYLFKQYEESGVRFMLNCFKWLEGDTDEILIETKNYFTNLINVTAQQSKTVSILTIYILPGLILLVGLAVYLRRRNL
ncbi:MAG: GldG family protein [Clostridiales bacterium]|nr:GldG family protein [Clostridiales bacterium]